MIVKSMALKLPQEPGIYIFKKQGKPIYIGKSISIRSRVLSHLAQAVLSVKEAAIINSADSIETHTTLSNFDAILLEADFIKKYKPKYNVSWKDDKNYLYIKITTKDTYPKIFPVRKEQDGKSKYFGPFGSTKVTHTLIYELRRIIPFCTQKKIGKRGCFYSKIGLCRPCPNVIEKITDTTQQKKLKTQYRSSINRVIRLLSGQSHTTLNDIEKKMNQLTKNERYEDAIIARDTYLQFSHFLERKSFDRYIYTPSADKNNLQEELHFFLKKYFSYKLNKNSYRVECYDISNLQGSYPTGSLVVCKNGELSKSDYKKFSVRRKGISDIHMLEEVLQRRFKHKDWGQPDLIILDGGKPQLRTIYQLFKKQHVTIPVISIAKRPDRIVIPFNGFKPISLRKEQALYRLIQSLRDESHRFAKKYHVFLRDRNRLN